MSVSWSLVFELPGLGWFLKMQP